MVGIWAALLGATILPTVADGDAPVVEHSACTYFVAGQSVQISARIADASAIFDPRIVFRLAPGASWQSIRLQWNDERKVLLAQLPTTAETTTLEYFLEVFDEHGNGPGRVGSPTAPLRSSAAASADPCVNVAASPSGLGTLAYFAKVDVGAGALLDSPQTLVQQTFGGSAVGALGLAYALGSTWLATRIAVEAEAGWFGFPGKNLAEAGGVGFAAAGFGVINPLTRDYDMLELAAHIGAGKTGPFWRLVVDATVGFTFRLGALHVGPQVRYMQIVDGPEGSEGDANILSVGVRLGFLPGSDTPPDEVAMPATAALLVASLDHDQDGVPDRLDGCAEEREDGQGAAPGDGCPENLDGDADGVPDLRDACPAVPEDVDGFADDDGCPDLDNDEDGLADLDDVCPFEPGLAADEGCPVRDRDGDKVPDEADQCPDVPGKPPIGCPSRILVVKTDKAIEIKEKINFKTNKAAITGQVSFEILDQVASVLRSNPQLRVRVEGHTDERAGADYNLLLSTERAAAVREALLSRGIQPSRLESRGFGETRPLASNKTERGKALNRRVEFVILLGEEAAPMPPPVPMPK